MKTLSFIILLSASFTADAQFIDAVPERSTGVDEADYLLAKRIIEETWENIDLHEGVANYVNYWNMAIVYTILELPKEQVVNFLQESRNLNPVGFDKLLSYAKTNPTGIRWREYIGPEKFNAIVNAKTEPPHQAADQSNERAARIASYSDLQRQLLAISEADEQFRGETVYDATKQGAIDRKNLEKIDSLFVRYERYIGVDLVGEDLARVMWLVIQHSDVETMKRYLPVIRIATSSGQLPGNVPLKMLIDRICVADYGVQPYGSQVGVPVANAVQMRRLKELYPITSFAEDLINQKLLVDLLQGA